MILIFAVMFDCPLQVKASEALGLEEIDLVQKLHEIIKANPGKAESLFEKFRQILEEEGKEKLICNFCESQPPSSSASERIKMFHKRDIELGKGEVAKQKQISKGKKVTKEKERQDIKSRKREKKQTGEEDLNKPRKHVKKKKQKEKKKNMKAKEGSHKRKKNRKSKQILKMKKRKMRQRNGQSGKYEEKMEKLNKNCTILWAELTYVGIGAAATLKRQVVKIDLVILHSSFSFRQIP